MRIPLAALFSFLLCSLFFPAAATRASADDPLSTLRKEHPRLLFTARDWAAFDQRARNRANDPQFDALLAQLEKNARAILAAPPLERKLTGRRLLGVSREALRRVLTLAVAYRSTQNEAFLQRAEQEMLAAAEFDNWNPSHFLDVGEMTAALALGYDWFYEKLSPETRATIRRAIVAKGLREGIDPKLRRNYWHRVENNWNQVCLGGLSLGALAIAEDEPELARDMLKAARTGIANGLRPYAPDGIYPEGPGYWSYGTTYQVLLVAALESALGTDWNLSASPGFLASANVQLHLTGPTGKQFNFSDCGNQGFFDPILYWFARKLNNPVLAAPPNLKSKDRFLPLVALWWPDGGLAPRNTEPGLPLAWKGEGINPIAAFRSSWTDPSALFLACKAGAANASHGHMDAGSFILEADGVRWAIDLGMQGYESLESKGMRIFGRTQDAQRWTVFRMNNFSHNTLTIDNQPHRVDGRSEFVKFGDTGATIDLSPVFSGQTKNVRRDFHFDARARAVTITDTLDGAPARAEIRWAMVTKAKVTISPDGGSATLIQKGKQLHASLLPGQAGSMRFETIPAEASPKNNYDAPNPGTHILIVRAKASAKGSAAIAVRLRAGEASH